MLFGGTTLESPLCPVLGSLALASKHARIDPNTQIWSLSIWAAWVGVYGTSMAPHGSTAVSESPTHSAGPKLLSPYLGWFCPTHFILAQLGPQEVQPGVGMIGAALLEGRPSQSMGQAEHWPCPGL